MKKLLFFAFAAALCCGLTACGGDDDNNGNGDDNGNYAELLVGSWKVEKEFSDGEWDIWDSGKGEDIFFFGPNGTGYNTGWEAPGGEWDDDFTYELVGKRIFIYYEASYGYADTDFWVIKKLTETELVVQEVEEDGTVEEEIYLRRTF